MTTRPAAVFVLALEGVLGVAWVALLLLEPGVGSWFLPADVAPELIRTFVVADIVFFAALPLVAAAGLHGRRAWAWPMLCLHTGGVVYAALWAWGLVGARGVGWLGALAMTPPALVGATLVCAFRPEARSDG